MSCCAKRGKYFQKMSSKENKAPKKFILKRCLKTMNRKEHQKPPDQSKNPKTSECQLPKGFQPMYTSTPKRKCKSLEAAVENITTTKLGTRLTMSQFIGEIPKSPKDRRGATKQGCVDARNAFKNSGGTPLQCIENQEIACNTQIKTQSNVSWDDKPAQYKQRITIDDDSSTSFQADTSDSDNNTEEDFRCIFSEILSTPSKSSDQKYSTQLECQSIKATDQKKRAAKTVEFPAANRDRTSALFPILNLDNTECSFNSIFCEIPSKPPEFLSPKYTQIQRQSKNAAYANQKQNRKRTNGSVQFPAVNIRRTSAQFPTLNFDNTDVDFEPIFETLSTSPMVWSQRCTTSNTHIQRQSKQKSYQNKKRQRKAVEFPEANRDMTSALFPALNFDNTECDSNTFFGDICWLFRSKVGRMFTNKFVRKVI